MRGPAIIQTRDAAFTLGRRTVHWVVIALAPAFLTGTAKSQNLEIYMSGDVLASICHSYMLVRGNEERGTTQEQGERFECYGFVVGSLDAITHEEAQTSRSATPRICLPPGTNAKTVTEVVANYTDTHPEKRQTSGYVLLRMAIAEAWPCQEQTP